MQVLEVHLCLRPIRAEALSVLAHVTEAHGVNSRHLHGAGDFGLCAADAGFQLGVLLQNRLATVVVRLAERRQLQRAMRPVHQLSAQAFLQLRDDLANRRLRDIVGLPSQREITAAGHIAKHFERAEMHGPILPCCNLISMGYTINNTNGPGT